MPETTQEFKGWLKPSNNIKLSSDTSVLRLTHEGNTSFTSLSDLNTKSVETLPIVCKNRILAIEADPSNSIEADDSVHGASISSILVSRPITVFNAEKCYSSIAREIIPKKWAMQVSWKP